MRFRSRPAEIEAVQFDPCGVHRLKLPDGVSGIPSGGADNWAYEGCVFFVVTIHGQRADIVAGDWIITEPDGIHHYPCKPDVFAKRWEWIDDTAPAAGQEGGGSAG